MYLGKLIHNKRLNKQIIDVINDENNRGYVVVQAVESLFRIIDRGITDRKNAEKLNDIKDRSNYL